MPEDKPQNSKNIDIQVDGDATLEGVAIGDRNKIISQVREIHGPVVQADHSQVHIGDIYYYFEIPKSDVIKKDPYKFLSTYGLEDEHIFFGRKAAIQELSSQILSQKFVIVNGKSGSGKSSLIHAGITPRLLRNNHLVIHVKEYLTSPLDTIQAAISSDLESSLVIFLDQFERFFIYLPLEERLRFTTALKGWLDDTTSKVRFVVAIRMDFFGRIGEFQKVIRDIYQQSAIFTLEPLNRDEAREAIEGPLEEMGIRIVYDDTLITVLLDRLLEDAEIEPAQLQIVCDELYRKAKEQNIKILKEDGIYQELGGVEGMLKSYLQRKLTEYTPQDEAVKRVLKQMIAPVEISAGIRTFVEAPQIAKRLNVPEDEVAPLIERLVDDRLIEKKETDGQATYSLAHEYMAGQVQEWFDPKETAIRNARDILSHAMQYDVPLESQQTLQVNEYEQELELNEQEQDFLKRCLKKHYRRVWLRRAVVATISLFAVIAAIFGGFAYIQREEAIFQKGEAQKREQEVDVQRKKAIFQKGEAEKREQEAIAERQKAEQAKKEAVKARKEVESLFYRSIVQSLAVKVEEQAQERQYELSPLLARQAYLFSQRYDSFTLSLVDEVLRPISSGIISISSKGPFSSAAFNSDGTRLALGSDDGTIRVWKLGESDAAGTHLALGNYDEGMWELVEPNATPVVLTEHDDTIEAMVFSSDNHKLASSSNDGTVRLWDLQQPDAESVVLEENSPDYNYAVAFSPDGTRLASVGYGTIGVHKFPKVWNLQDLNAEPVVLEGYVSTISSITFSPDGTRLASGAEGDVFSSPDGTRLVSGAEGEVQNYSGYAYTIWLWDLEQPPAAPVLLEEHEGGIRSVAFSSDKKWLASGSGTEIEPTGIVRVWNLQDSDSEATILKGHEEPVLSLAFSPDNKKLASSSQDQTVRLWDIENLSAKPVVLRGHEGEILSLVFTPGGQTLFSVDSKGIIRVWIPTGQLADNVCKQVRRNLTMLEWQQFVGQDIPYESSCPDLPIHPSAIKAGAELAISENASKAISIFEESLASEARAEMAPIVVEAGQYLARGGKVNEAIEQFKKALVLDPTLNLNPDAEARTAITMVTMRALMTALGAYEVDNDKFPVCPEEKDLNKLEFPEGSSGNFQEYINDTSLKDDWGTPFRYVSDGDTYRLISYGADKTKGGSGADADIIIENGRFIGSD